jgi:hypothetical protein
VARDQAHRLAAAKTADSDNAYANAHGGVLLGFGQKKTPGAEGCGGSGTRAGAAPAGGTYGEAVTTRKDADRRAAREAAAWTQGRRRRSQRVWFLSMSCDTVAAQIYRQAECLLTTFYGPYAAGSGRPLCGRPLSRSDGRNGRTAVGIGSSWFASALPELFRDRPEPPSKPTTSCALLSFARDLE